MERSELTHIASEFVKHLRPRKNAVVIGFLGELGAGKTTFIQAIARAFGITATVQSPTFVLMKKYRIPHSTFRTLVHIDAYRLDDPPAGGELASLGWKELLADSGNLILVEWADRVKEILPEDTIYISLEHVSELERKMTISNERI